MHKLSCRTPTQDPCKTPNTRSYRVFIKKYNMTHILISHSFLDMYIVIHIWFEYLSTMELEMDCSEIIKYTCRTPPKIIQSICDLYFCKSLNNPFLIPLLTDNNRPSINYPVRPHTRSL